jgi:hypothetical protein
MGELEAGPWLYLISIMRTVTSRITGCLQGGPCMPRPPQDADSAKSGHDYAVSCLHACCLSKRVPLMRC